MKLSGSKISCKFNKTLDRRLAMKHSCSFEGCDKPIEAKKLCNTHYKQMHNLGKCFPITKEIGAPKKWLEENKDFEGNECLPWPFAKRSDGYGWFQQEFAHRAMLIRSKGPPPNNIQINALHTCDNPICCNRKHLYWGSLSQNQIDRYERTGYRK